jgi:D-inositol-3-phosphate glycosyltransferase
VASVLLISHTHRHSGFGRICVGIAAALSVEHQVHVIGIGATQHGDSWTGHEHHELDMACTTALREWARSTPPEVIVLIGVSQLLAWQAERLRLDGFTGILVAYVPVEGPVWAPEMLERLRSCTQVVAYHRVGLGILKNVLGPGTLLSCIYHGVGSTPALRTASRHELRATLFPALTHLAGRTWLLNANRNDERKCPELCLQAFARIAASVPDTALLLHCEPQRPGVDLRYEADRLGLADQVIFTRDLIPGIWSDDQLWQLYSCCEIGLNSALAEGWGLIAFEHALHGGAQVMPAHAGLKEIWGTAPEWVSVGEASVIDHVFAGKMPVIETFSAALLHLIQDPEARRANSEACHDKARQQQFSWKTISIEWRELISSLLTKN